MIPQRLAPIVAAALRLTAHAGFRPDEGAEDTIAGSISVDLARQHVCGNGARRPMTPTFNSFKTRS